MSEPEAQPRCCRGHVKPYESVGWCVNSYFDGCEPCCDRCPDYDWDMLYDEWPETAPA